MFELDVSNYSIVPNLVVQNLDVERLKASLDRGTGVWYNIHSGKGQGRRKTWVLGLLSLLLGGTQPPFPPLPWNFLPGSSVYGSSAEAVPKIAAPFRRITSKAQS